MADSVEPKEIVRPGFGEFEEIAVVVLQVHDELPAPPGVSLLVELELELPLQNCPGLLKFLGRLGVGPFKTRFWPSAAVVSSRKRLSVLSQVNRAD